MFKINFGYSCSKQYKTLRAAKIACAAYFKTFAVNWFDVVEINTTFKDGTLDTEIIHHTIFRK